MQKGIIEVNIWSVKELRVNFAIANSKNKYSLHEHLRTHHGLTQSMLKSARVVPKLKLVEEPDQKLSFQQLDWSKRPME